MMSDIGMPGQDGYDLISSSASAADHGGGLNCLAAYAGSTTSAGPLRGYQMHLAKPIKPSALTQAIAASSLADDELSAAE